VKHIYLAALAGATLLAGAGTGIGLAATSDGGAGHGTLTTASQPATAGTVTTASAADYAYYRSVMTRFGMRAMAGSGEYGYGWMMGTRSAAPRWMVGGSLPGAMMGGGMAGSGMMGESDLGAVMGRLFADAPGPRMSAGRSVQLGSQVPAGATVNTAADRVVFHAGDVSLVVVAVPSVSGGEYQVAGLVDPTLVVPVGARVSIELINTDTDVAHGLVVTTMGAATSSMPMAADVAAFPGAAVWFLGDPTMAGMHAGTMTFTASAPGTYQYLSPPPGQARNGMAGTLIVAAG
jgi:plastocyanin